MRECINWDHPEEGSQTVVAPGSVGRATSGLEVAELDWELVGSVDPTVESASVPARVPDGRVSEPAVSAGRTAELVSGPARVLDGQAWELVESVDRPVESVSGRAPEPEEPASDCRASIESPRQRGIVKLP